MILRNLSFLLLSVLFMNCHEGVDTADLSQPLPAKKGNLISAMKGARTSKGTLRLMATGFGQSELAGLLRYDVDAYTLTYTTTYKGSSVQASGIVMVPAGITEPAALVSLQHGTEFEKSNAPSVRAGFQGVEFLASAGYVALMPDYLGYGVSSDLFHPYYDRALAAAAVVDMVKAAKEFLGRERVALKDSLFLAGYSEGGFVTLAAAREIEENPRHGLSVTAIAAGAGGYDLPHMLAGITTRGYYAYPAYLAFVLMSYNLTYDWKRPLTDFFRDRYANALEQYLTGEYGGGFINSRLTTDVRALFQPEFFRNLHTAGAEQALKDALEANSVSGWKTQVPIRLYHGTKDEIIPYQNSQATLEKFKSAGSHEVSLTLIPNGTHGNSFVPMLRSFIPWFLDLEGAD